MCVIAHFEGKDQTCRYFVQAQIIGPVAYMHEYALINWYKSCSSLVRHEACRVPDLRMLSQMSQLESELQEPDISLWCRTDSSCIDLQHQAQLISAGWQILIGNCCLLMEACWRTVTLCFLLISSHILLRVILRIFIPFDSRLAAGSSAWGSPNKASMRASTSIMPLNGWWPTSWFPRAKTKRRCGTMQCPIVWCLTPMEPPCFLSSRSRPWALTWNLGWPSCWLSLCLWSSSVVVAVVVVVVSTFFWDGREIVIPFKSCHWISTHWVTHCAFVVCMRPRNAAKETGSLKSSILLLDCCICYRIDL